MTSSIFSATFFQASFTSTSGGTGASNGDEGDFANILAKLEAGEGVGGTNTEAIEEALRDLLEKIIDMQMQLLGGNDESEAKDEFSIADILGSLDSQKSAINAQIIQVSVTQVDLYIQQNNLEVSPELYQEALEQVRRAVSGEEAAALYGLPEGQLLDSSHLGVVEEAQLREQQVYDALDRVLGHLKEAQTSSTEEAYA